MSQALVLETEPAPRLASVDALVLAFRWRPRIRAHCAGVPRPCPYVSCRHNTFLFVAGRWGELQFAHPGLEPDEVPTETSCALDVAADNPDGMSWRAIGDALNMSDVSAEQIAYRAMGKLHLLLRDER